MGALYRYHEESLASISTSAVYRYGPLYRGTLGRGDNILAPTYFHPSAARKSSIRERERDTKVRTLFEVDLLLLIYTATFDRAIIFELFLFDNFLLYVLGIRSLGISYTVHTPRVQFTSNDLLTVFLPANWLEKMGELFWGTDFSANSERKCIGILYAPYRCAS